VHVCLLAHALKGVATDRWEDFGDLIIEGANSPEGGATDQLALDSKRAKIVVAQS